MVTVLRPLSISELLDRTFHLYRNHFLVFVGIIAIPQLVVLALELVNAATLVPSPLARFSALNITAAIVSYIAIEISAAATVIAVSNYHLDRPVSLGSAFAQAKGSMVRVILITFAIAIASGIALIFFVIPGVYLWLMWSLAIPVTVLEGGGLNASTRRSQMLTKGARGRIFAVLLLLIVLGMVVGFLFQFPLGLLAVLLRTQKIEQTFPIISALTAVGSFLSTSLVGPLGTIVLTLIYYDQRVRKEGFDLQLMMATLQPGAQLPGDQPPAAAAAAPNS